MKAKGRLDSNQDKEFLLKRVEDGADELEIALSLQKIAQNPHNHCVPLVDELEMPRNGSTKASKLMVMPFLLPFQKNPRLQTFHDFVELFTQICEVGSFNFHRHESILIELWIRVFNSCTNETSHTGARGRLQPEGTHSEARPFQGLHSEQHHVRATFPLPD